ncbi:calcium-binding protein [Streptomyces sp. NBC_01498]|uniref:calcium-binding protein n=1 Tax=Streptomyces sp. NBC_01498 TaxID=2975870 RepID=UPI002E7C1274|nr:calcium-binding protein [Streptomyces sp. NBC_01498]WTL23360.1 calcium-binding protein [Streptomyces sp. NBC_01498]
MTRHAVVALTLAAAVGGLTAPTALADSAPVPLAAGPAAALDPTDPVVTGVTVNGGKDVVVGTTERVSFTVTVHGSDDSGLLMADVDLQGPAVGFYTTDAFCESQTACTMSFTVDPHLDPYNDDADLSNANAGAWRVNTLVDTNDGVSFLAMGAGTFRLQRASLLTVNAAPEPVAKGATLTVTGKLTRANWDTYRYAGYTGRPVALQFRPKDSDTYSTVKTVTTNGTGNLSTTVKAAADGYWRWNFAGTTTTPAAKATGDYVEVN